MIASPKRARSTGPARKAPSWLFEHIVPELVGGLRFAAERQGLSLHGYDVERIAEVLARRVVAAGLLEPETVQALLAEERDKTVRWKQNWAASEVNADRQLLRLQAALTDLASAHRAAAEQCAQAAGVLLHLEDEDEADDGQLALDVAS